MCCCCHPEVLQQRVAALEQERAEFIKLKQQLEAEFNQKRAKFKELYLSKEGMGPIIMLAHWDCSVIAVFEIINVRAQIGNQVLVRKEVTI